MVEEVGGGMLRMNMVTLLLLGLGVAFLLSIGGHRRRSQFGIGLMCALVVGGILVMWFFARGGLSHVRISHQDDSRRAAAEVAEQARQRAAEFEPLRELNELPHPGRIEMSENRDSADAEASAPEIVARVLGHVAEVIRRHQPAENAAESSPARSQIEAAQEAVAEAVDAAQAAQEQAALTAERAADASLPTQNVETVVTAAAAPSAAQAAGSSPATATVITGVVGTPVVDPALADPAERDTAENRTLAEAKDLPSSAAVTEISGSDTEVGRTRPAWVEERALSVGQVDRRKLHVGPWANRTLCEEELAVAIQNSVRIYVAETLGEDIAARQDLKAGYLRSRILKDQWEERLDSFSLGPQYYLHALLEFDDQIRQDFKQRAEQVRQNEQQQEIHQRLTKVGFGTGLVVALVGVVFSYLKLDTLTRGYYTGRLRLLATAAILGLAAVVAMLVDLVK